MTEPSHGDFAMDVVLLHGAFGSAAQLVFLKDALAQARMASRRTSWSSNDTVILRRATDRSARAASQRNVLAYMSSHGLENVDVARLAAQISDFALRL